MGLEPTTTIQTGAALPSELTRPVVVVGVSLLRPHPIIWALVGLYTIDVRCNDDCYAHLRHPSHGVECGDGGVIATASGLWAHWPRL